MSMPKKPEAPRDVKIHYNDEGGINVATEDFDALVARMIYDNKVEGGQARALLDMPPEMAIEEMIFEMELTLPDGQVWKTNPHREHPSVQHDRDIEKLMFNEDGTAKDITIDFSTHYVDDQGEVRKKIARNTLSQYDHRQGITTGSPDPDALNDSADMLLAAQQGLDFDDEEVQDKFPDLDDQ